jgi:glycosyltransferase involved in cell wall biosynthesis
MTKIKITHLSTAHNRYDIRIFIKLCSSLASEGHKVSLVVADNLGNEIKNGVSIIDVGAKNNSRFFRMTSSVKNVFKKAKELDSDIYHFHDPELIPIGLKLKNLGKKVIFDIHENTDLQILEKDWIPLIFRKLTAYIYRKYEDYACKKYDLLIVPQEAMYKKYNKLSKTIVISNFPKKNNKLNLELKELNKYSLLYAGAISESRGLFNMLNLIEELNLIDNKYRLTLAGVISLDLLEKSKLHKGWKHTEYLGFLTKEEIQEVYARNSIGLILFNNVGQYFMAYSLKLFEYMQNSMFVVMPNFGDWINFNNSFNVGINVNTTDSKMIAKQIHTLNKEQMTQIGEDNIQKVDKYFSWDSQEIKLFKTYNEVINVK